MKDRPLFADHGWERCRPGGDVLWTGERVLIGRQSDECLRSFSSAGRQRSQGARLTSGHRRTSFLQETPSCSVLRSMKQRIPPAAVAADVHPGFQIAPMIDVVFVIMLFFMAMAASLKAERRLSTWLPTSTCSPEHQEPPNQISIGITETGEISLNEALLAEADLTITLKRLGQRSRDLHEQVLVTFKAEPLASYQRIMDVLNVIAVAGLSNVTFSVGGEEV